MMDYITTIAQALSLGIPQVSRTVELLEGGATVPFVARYRKEATGNLNEVQIAAIRDLLAKLKEIDKRREAIRQSIGEQGKLTPELTRLLNEAQTLTELEDLYLPFRPKRRTRASVAAEKGFSPLADQLLLQGAGDVEAMAQPFAEKAETSVEEALAGARDIIAERVSEDIQARNRVRKVFGRKAMLSSTLVKGKEQEAGKFKSWFDWKESAAKAPSHRILALLRGEEEGMLRVHVLPEREEECVEVLERQWVRGNTASAHQVQLAVADGYKRLLSPSIENETRTQLKERADREAIQVFAENLRQLLLASPLGQKRILAIDPGFRTGCKCVCLDAQGNLLHNETIYPFASKREEREAMEMVQAMVREFQVEAIAIGNGTAGRETEEFVHKVVDNSHFSTLNSQFIVMVSEQGASVYSASESAREEFPEYDITVRGAVSIGRRLMDPLAELVKIDPKSIGVGQYQHDVNQTLLRGSLNDVVTSCVNSVGVELNTASKELLSYVSGIGPALAENIVDYRWEEGPFRNRKELLKVHRLGAKAFEQCAGFLRLRESDNPLDRSAVHPERYELVERMAQSVGASVEELMKRQELRAQIRLEDFVSEECGLPTLQDIMRELDKPGLDPREKFEVFQFDPNVKTIEDLQEGMVLPGIVTNITAFGAFVDVGVHQDGLVHVSQMAARRVNDPKEVVHLRQQVTVKVIDVDLQRNRISLSLRV